MKSDNIKKGKPARQPRARRACSPKVTKTTNTHRSSISSTDSSSIQPQDLSLASTLETLKPHDHLCLIYESHEEWRAAAVPFISIGLKHGEKCIYVVDTSTADEIRKYLNEEGIDVASVENSGQLSILHETEAYTREGSFDPDKMIALLISETEKAIANGYPALRATGEMTWVLRDHPGSERLLEYEAKLNRDFFPKHPCLALCQYDRWKFEPEVIKGVIMTHPLLVRGNNICHNFYYIPPEEYLNQKRAQMEVQYCLNNLERERQIQETLHQSEEMYRTLTEQSLQGIAVMQDFRIVFANAAFAEISGYNVEELLSMPPAKVQAMIHPEDQALVWGRFKDRLAGKMVPHRYEYRGIRKDQTVRWLEMHSSRIQYGGKPAILGAIIDITERKRTEQALEEREKFLDNVIEQTPNPMWISDEKGTVSRMNQALRDLLKITDQEIIGKYNVLKDVQVEEQGLLPLVRSVFEKGETVNFTIDYYTEKEKQVELEQKTHKVLNIVISPIKNKEGKILNAICQHMDITERKKADEELKKTLAELQRSNAELERFVYVASHDLQEPLRMVSSYMQLLERRYKDKLDADANDFINYAVSGANRMQELLNDLLVYSRVGTRAKPFKRTNMEAVLKAAMDNLQVSIKESKTKVSHDPLPTVMTDEGQMVQVLQNLIGNASKFRSEKSPRIHISAEQRGSEWVFSVKDNGIGIDPQHFERVFLIFQRLHRDEYPGTGTGLAIAQKIVERHGGHMWVESQPGKGSTFYFSIQAKGERHNRRETEGNS